MKILVLNAGSSSFKCSLFDLKTAGELGVPEEPIWEGDKIPASLEEIDVVGHRIVHGGPHFQEPELVTEHVKDVIRQYFPLAPLHNQKGLEGIERMESLGVPQVAVFDTAFHSTLSEVASTYPGPYEWKELGIKRYGFHGISYEYCAARCAKLLNNNALKIVCCHLGNGASLAAIDKGRSIDTTMGFTPLEGLMMGSRSGSIDPGILLYLQESKEELYNTLNSKSGLLGISGRTNDMKEILALRSKGDKRASLSFDMYIHSLKKNIGAMAAVLDGYDVLVFTGGIGEHAAAVREAVSKNFLVVPSKEDWCIAHQIMRLYGKL